MKALTICNPYPELILPPLLEKPIENRTWATAYRGPLLIHAGKSREWMSDSDERSFPLMVFGAFVGIADLVACLWLKDKAWPVEFEGLRYHQHANGPCCWVLTNPRRFHEPVPCRGAQGLWEPPSDVVAILRDMEAV